VRGNQARPASRPLGWQDTQRYLRLGWQLSSRWWVLIISLLVLLSTTFLALWAGRDTVIGGTAEDPYLLREFLVDGSDVALKLGAVIAGVLGVYRYWYRRYEPLIYFVACSPCPVLLLTDLLNENGAFRRVCERVRLPDKPQDRDWERVHELPLIVFHSSSIETLGIQEGSPVDLRFETPDAKVIWAVALAFTFESMAQSMAKYEDWPVALSLSLRRYFRIERPFHDYQGKTKQRPPPGWQRVEVFKAGYARLHGTTQHGEKLVWIASDGYSVRFRDPNARDRFHNEDDPGENRVLEYVGISLRVYRRSGLRYRGSD
jgi:hypothetical protein